MLIPPPPDTFVGVWEAHTTNGPALHGNLTVWEDHGQLSAEIGGVSATCRRTGSRLQATFVGDLGTFRGAILPNGAIEGHWIQPTGVMFGAYASPVHLVQGPGHVWVGTVKPLPDAANFYLVVRRTEAGKLGVFLRNPDRNLGVFIQPEELLSDPGGVHLMGHNRGRSDIAELARGTYDAPNEILSLYFPGRALGFSFTKISADKASGFYARPLGSPAYRYRPPIQRPDGWAVADAKTVGLSAPAIERFIRMIVDLPDDSVHSPNVHGVFLARYGKLILDEYFHGYSADRPHDLRSAAKSFTSVLAGAAMRESTALRLDTPILDILGTQVRVTSPDARKSKITVQNLLTMSAGLDCDDNNDDSPGNEDTMQSQTADPNYYHYTLNVPMAFEPGAKAVYGSALPNLLGGVIAADRQVWLPEYFRDRIARPLEIDDYYVPLSPDGEGYMGGGIQLRPRDFMKLGQMMLDGGTWKGRRLLDRAYVEQSVTPRYAMSGIRYGFLWWIMEYPFRGETLQAYFAAGNGGQVVMVIPKLSLVFGCVAGNYSDDNTHIFQREWFPKYVLPMIEGGK